MQLVAIFTLAFAAAPLLKNLTLLHTVTRRSIIQKVRGHSALTSMELPQLVGTWFQILLTPLPGFFSPFTRATGSLSVIREYLALGGGPPRFIPDSTWLVLLGCANRKVSEFRLQGFHLVSPRLSKRVRLSLHLVTSGIPCRESMPRPTTPIRQRLHPWHRIGLGSVPFARRY
jgi:hypothetical protein